MIPTFLTGRRPRAASLLAFALAAALGGGPLACAPGAADTGDDHDGDLAAAAQPVTALTNLAQGKPTSQSPDAYTGAGESWRAVDGNTDGTWTQGSVTHTISAAQAWWQVDLQSVQAIGSVVVWNRTDCCSDRLSSFNLLVSDDGVSWQTYAFVGPAPRNATFNVNRSARYVKVQLTGANYLSLAEVQVFAATPTLSPGLPRVPNLAQGKPARQPSTYNAEGIAAHAVDGNTDGQFAHGSVTHTGLMAQPWWEVDLGQSQPIGSVVLWNRTDCCSERLSGFNLLLSDDDTNWQSYPYAGTAPASVTFNVNRPARYVRVQLDGTGYLSLAEVQVLPPSPQDHRARVVDLAGGAPGAVRYQELWGDSFVLSGWLDARDRHLTGDFLGLGRDQVMHVNRDYAPGAGKIMMIDHAGGAAPGAVRYGETWDQTQLLSGWLDDDDLSLPGDFLGLGHSQVMYVNRGGAGGKIMILDYASGVPGGVARYFEGWGATPLLDGWLDGNDLQLTGDFLGLGHSQVMYVNRGGTGGKIMVVDYASGATGGAVKYFEGWGATPLLNGWLDDNDLQLVGDFLGLGHSQVMYVNRGGTGGKIMVVDYASGATGGAVKYFESWGANPLLGGWLDDGDHQLVGDFLGLGHSQVLFHNAQDAGNGKLMVVDYASGASPGAVRYFEGWGQAGSLDRYLGAGDVRLVGDFAGVKHAEILGYNFAAPVPASRPGNQGCQAGQTPTASGTCAAGTSGNTIYGRWALSGGKAPQSPSNPVFQAEYWGAPGPVTFKLTSSADAFLYLIDGNGSVVASDDNSGGGTDARLTAQLAPGTYQVVAATAAPGQTADFTLSSDKATLRYPQRLDVLSVTATQAVGYAGSNNTAVAQMFRPDLSQYPGYASLGDVAVNAGGTGMTFLVRGEGDLLAAPLAYNLVSVSQVSPLGNVTTAFWEPVAPSGYTCLGSVAVLNSFAYPSLDLVRCVKSTQVRPATATAIGAGVYRADPQDHRGLALSQFSLTPPSATRQYWVLDKSATGNAELAGGVVDAEMARRYAPRVWLSDGESYLPSSVDFFLPNVTDQVSGGQHYYVTNQALGCPSCTDPTFLDGQRPDQVDVPVYAEIVNRTQGGQPTNITDVVYFMFYPYNNGKRVCMGYYSSFFGGCIGGYSSFGNHVGDWEHVTVRFVDGRPAQVALSQHDGGQILDYGSSLLPLFNGRPVVFAAEGSHGLYPDARSHVYKNLDNGDYLSDDTSYGIAWDTWRAPVVFPSQPLGSYTGSLSWLNYDGRWGNPKDGCGLFSIIEALSGECILNDGPGSLLSRSVSNPASGTLE
jgi:hypothetical protein